MQQNKKYYIFFFPFSIARKLFCERRRGGGRIKRGLRGRGGDRSSEKARREVAATMDHKKEAWPETPAVAKDSAAGICLFISVRLDLSMSVSVSASTFRVCI